MHYLFVCLFRVAVWLNTMLMIAYAPARPAPTPSIFR